MLKSRCSSLVADCPCQGASSLRFLSCINGSGRCSTVIAVAVINLETMSRGTEVRSRRCRIAEIIPIQDGRSGQVAGLLSCSIMKAHSSATFGESHQQGCPVGCSCSITAFGATCSMPEINQELVSILKALFGCLGDRISIVEASFYKQRYPFFLWKDIFRRTSG